MNADTLSRVFIVTLPFHAAVLYSKVLSKFRDRFIEGVDANAIIFDLKDKKIMDGGNVTAISEKKDPDWQNRYLHNCLVAKCTNDALMKVCNIIIAAGARGHPRMKKLGEDMKSMLEGM